MKYFEMGKQKDILSFIEKTIHNKKGATMLKKLFYNFFVIGLLFTNIALYAQENSEKKAPREKLEQVHVEGIVESIDATTREIVLRGPLGNLITMTADKSIERFDEIKKDDVIEADYFKYMLAEFREPTAEEIAEPLVILAEGGKAPEGMDPAAVVGALVKAVVTVEIINRPFMYVTIRGPLGNYHSIDVEDKAILEELNIGEVVILTYVEAVALSLKKVSASK